MSLSFTVYLRRSGWIHLDEENKLSWGDWDVVSIDDGVKPLTVKQMVEFIAQRLAYEGRARRPSDLPCPE